MLPVERYQRFSTAGVLTTGQSSLTIMPAVAGYTYVVVNGTLTCLVSAAQGAYLGDSSGTKKALQIAASVTTNEQKAVQLVEGYPVTPSEALVLKPDSAGPSFHAIVEGYILKNSAVLGTTT